MSMSTSIKDTAKKLVEDLPEDATWEDLQYQVHLRQAIEIGLKDAEEGRVVSSDEARKRLSLGSS